jgi:2-polyprenyl-3-methyl-5-hydroxy-6-metoxy-1,4-benzoquinol methylase
MSRGTVEEAAEHWDRNYAKVAAPIRDWFESDYVKRNYVNAAVSGNPDCDWLSYAAETYMRAMHPKRLLDIGCGRGEVSITLTNALIVDESLGVDVSAEGIAGAAALSAQYGTQDKTAFQCADVCDLDFPEGHFEAIIINMALHHMLDLEQIMRKIRAWKTPSAPVVLHEYIGPNRFQWSDAALRAGTAMLESMPPELRVHGVTGAVVERLERPPYAAMLFGDPSEALRSADIVDVVGCYFELVERKDFGGTVLQPILADIVHNFDPENPGHSAILDGLFETERDLLRAGTLPSNFALMIYR